METNKSMLVNKGTWDELAKAVSKLEAEGRMLHYQKLSGIVNFNIFADFDRKLFEVRKIMALAQYEAKKKEEEEKRIDALEIV